MPVLEIKQQFYINTYEINMQPVENIFYRITSGGRGIMLYMRPDTGTNSLTIINRKG